jgi:transcriptional regulator with XRE-family HTH domain
MEPITTDIGSRILQARERRALTIRNIANTTKISAAALSAIEHNDFARLPSVVFSRAYLGRSRQKWGWTPTNSRASIARDSRLK